MWPIWTWVGVSDIVCWRTWSRVCKRWAARGLTRPRSVAPTAACSASLQPANQCASVSTWSAAKVPSSFSVAIHLIVNARVHECTMTNPYPISESPTGALCPHLNHSPDWFSICFSMECFCLLQLVCTSCRAIPKYASAHSIKTGKSYSVIVDSSRSEFRLYEPARKQP